MTSRERLHRLFFYEEMDRPAVIVRFWGFRDCFDDRRGLAVSPTASPFMLGRGRDCYPQYAAMVETVTAWKP